ncbi:MAG: hypothetical protein KDB22_04395 [Planctomycetales bacterium]|nr:hypothetical protein [Planctomycetales bacterium]
MKSAQVIFPQVLSLEAFFKPSACRWSLTLLFLFNPAIANLRAVEQASELRKAKRSLAAREHKRQLVYEYKILVVGRFSCQTLFHLKR